MGNSEIVELQHIHMQSTGMLIEYAYYKGDRLSCACARCVKHGHHKTGSLHYIGLAHDFNLWRRNSNGVFVYCTLSEDHRDLGDYWKSLHPLNCWGGDFKAHDGRPRPDGNHYSTTYKGRK